MTQSITTNRLAKALLFGTLFAATTVVPQTASARDADTHVLPPIHLTRYPTIRPYKNLPPLPIRLLPYEAIEPDRSRPAHAWRSPYCLRWDDGIEACSRAEDRIDRPATCRPIYMGDSGPSERSTIACRMVSLDDYLTVCQDGITVRTRGNRYQTAILGKVVFDFSKKEAIWKESDGSGFQSQTKDQINSTLVDTFNLFSEQRWKRRFPDKFIRGSELTMCMEPFKASEAKTYYRRIQR